MNKLLHGLASAVLLAACVVACRGGEPDAAKALVAKAIKAAGGEAKVAQLKAGSCKAKADIKEGGNQIAATIDITWQGIDQYRMTLAADIGGNAKNLLVVISDGKGWAKDLDNNRVDQAPEQAVPMITGTLYALRMPQFLPTLLDKETKLTALAEIKVGDRPALGVIVAHKDRKDVSLYFDKETGLPAKSEIRLTDPSGMEKTFEFLYQEYKEFAGLKHPTRIQIKAADNAEIVVELSDLKAQGKVDAKLFAAPE